MKMPLWWILLPVFMLLLAPAWAQEASDSTAAPVTGKVYTHRDSVNLARLNNSGNLMIAGGIGLTAAGSYLVYQGTQVYNGSTPSSTAEEIDKNHTQGIIYMVAGGLGIAGGIILTTFGARNKIEFKRQRKAMFIQSGLLESGRIGLACSF